MANTPKRIEEDEDMLDLSGQGGDDEFYVDFAEIEEFGTVPAGTYQCSCIHAEKAKSKSGQGKINLRWKIDDVIRINDAEVDESKLIGRQILDSLSFHPNALGMTKKRLKAMGLGESFKGRVNVDDLKGAECLLRVVVAFDASKIDPETDEPYPPQNRVKGIKPLQARRKAEDLL